MADSSLPDRARREPPTCSAHRPAILTGLLSRGEALVLLMAPGIEGALALFLLANLASVEAVLGRLRMRRLGRAALGRQLQQVLATMQALALCERPPSF
jgi:hypothetical protein